MWYAASKRFFDISCSAVGLLLLSPLGVLIALAIKLTDRGPVLFGQTRIGQFRKPFRIWKFRTMGVRPGGGASITVSGDPHITSVGKWLRRLKLDELPQLFNVLGGDMSVVGPRPDVPGYADRLTGDDARLLQLRPGITGLASLVFRDEEELLARAADPVWFNDKVLFPAKVRINLEYLDRIALIVDIRLILLTFLPFRVRHAERQRVEQMLLSNRRAVS